MPLQIINRNIVRMQCDAIVDPTDSFYSGSGGTDMAIHEAAGEALSAECASLPPLSFGEAAVTGGYALSCKYVIHTMGPVWCGGIRNEKELLRACYLNSLIRAKKLGLQSIAFPLIASGAFGFPKDRVLRIAIDAISDFLYTVDSELDVYICVLDRDSFVLSKEIALGEYINRSKRFIYEDHALKMERTGCASYSGPVPVPEKADFTVRSHAPAGAKFVPKDAKKATDNLSSWIKKQDDTFAVKLLKLIDIKGMTDVECYKKANVHKNVFWKIKNTAGYRPSKATVIAFAIALELSLDETQELLRSAGFSLSHNNTFDMIIEFYLINGIYDIFEINASLYKYDQMCLGC